MRGDAFRHGQTAVQAVAAEGGDQCVEAGGAAGVGQADYGHGNSLIKVVYPRHSIWTVFRR